MGTKENKAVVRRFTDEVLAGGNLSMADELCAPDFKGLEFSGIASFKAALTVMWAHVSECEVNIDELLAEGDSVVARCSYRLTRPDGSTTTSRGLSYYRLADGKIVKSEVMTVPDIIQVLWQREGDRLVQRQLRVDGWLASRPSCLIGLVTTGSANRGVPGRGGVRGVSRSLTDSLLAPLTCGEPGQAGIIHELLSSRARLP